MEISALRRLTIQADAPGVKESTAALNDLDAAHKRVAASAGATATITDQATRRQLSAEEAYRRQTLAIDAQARMLAQFEKAQRVASAALQQGVIDQQAYAQRLEQLREHYTNASTASGGFSSALKIVRETLGAFGVALSVGAVVEFGKSIFESTAHLDNQAKTLGISTDALQAYHAGAVLSGAGADIGDAAIQRFTRSLGDAQAGTKLQADAFQELGIHAYELAGGTEAVLPRAAAALLDIQDASQRARLEVELFGKSGQVVEQLLEKWADPELIGSMKEVGLTIDRELVQRAADLDKAWSAFWLHFKAGMADVLLGGEAMRAQQKLIEEHNAGARQATAGLTSAGDALAQTSGKAVVSPQLADILVTQPVDWGAIRDHIATVEGLAQFWQDAQKSEGDYSQKVGEQQGKIADDIVNHYAKVAENLQKRAGEETLELEKLLNAYSTAGVGMIAVTESAVAQAAQKIAEERAREEKRAADEVDTYWNRMFDNTFRSGQNFFTDLFSTGKVSLKSFLDDFERMFGTMLSDIAMKAIAKPIIMPIFEGIAGALGVGPGASGSSSIFSSLGSLGGLGSIFGVNGGSAASIDSQIPGSLGLGGYLGSGLLGAGVGSITGSLTGGNSTGASLGGLLGGIAGNFIPIPVVGPLIGSILGAAIGGLFGGGKSNFTAYANFGADYALGAAGGDRPNQQTTGLAAQLGSAVSAAAKSLEAAGVHFDNTITRLEIGSRDQTRLIGSGGTRNIGAAGDVAAATAGALGYLLGGASSSDSAVQGIIDKYRQAGHLSADFAQQLVTDIAAVKQKAADFDAFTKASADALLKFTDPAREGWQQLTDAQTARMKQALALGADIGTLERLNFEEQKQYLQQLNTAQRDSITGLLDLVGQLTVKVADLRDSALAAINTLISQSRAAADQAHRSAADYHNASSAIAAALSSITGSASSPQALLGNARSNFANTLNAAQRGDLSSLNALPELAKAYASASAGGVSTEQEYRRDLNRIAAGLKSAQLTADVVSAAADYQAKLYDVQTALLQATHDNLAQTTINQALLAQQLDALGRIGQLIRDSATVTVGAIGDAGAATVSLMGQSLTIQNSQTGQLVTIATGADQNAGDIISQLSLQASLQSIVAQISGANSDVSRSILSAMNGANGITSVLVGQVASGNAAIVSQLSLLIQAQQGLAEAQTAAEQARATADAAAAAAAASAAAAALAAVTTTTPHAMTPLEAALSLGPINSIGQGHNSAIMDIQAAILKGIAVSDASYAKAGISRIPGYADGGMFPGGWRVVGERGPELELTGPSRIVSNRQSLIDSGAIVAVLERLHAEVAELKKSNKKMENILIRVTRDGNSLLTTAA
jgi:hypothetical protein